MKDYLRSVITVIKTYFLGYLVAPLIFSDHFLKILGTDYSQDVISHIMAKSLVDSARF